MPTVVPMIIPVPSGPVGPVSAEGEAALIIFLGSLCLFLTAALLVGFVKELNYRKKNRLTRWDFEWAFDYFMFGFGAWLVAATVAGAGAFVWWLL
jgi:hypothetical protein